MSPEARYEPEWFTEDKCRRCGVCCGSQDGHPCEHLVQDGDRYFCSIYSARFGIHRTTTGRVFRCVSIREIIEGSGGFPDCGYRKPLLPGSEQEATPAQKELR